jgi:hypothetical protein
MDIEFYRFGSGYYFIDNNTSVEGKIVLGRGNHGGETYDYVSHIEFDEELPEFIEEQYKEYIDNHLNDVFRADPI